MTFQNRYNGRKHRSPKQIANSRRMAIKYFGEDTEAPEKFDCTNCGDPTHGSYHGAIMSNMCWKCTTEHNRDYGEWLGSLNLKTKE